MPRRKLRADAAVGRVEDRVGQVRKLLGDVGERGRAEHVAQRDAEQLLAAEARAGWRSTRRSNSSVFLRRTAPGRIAWNSPLRSGAPGRGGRSPRGSGCRRKSRRRRAAPRRSWRCGRIRRAIRRAGGPGIAPRRGGPATTPAAVRCVRPPACRQANLASTSIGSPGPHRPGASTLA